MCKLISFTHKNDIEDWFLIHENIYSTIDHNGTLTLDCLYVLSDTLCKDIGIFFSQSDNSLEISKSFQLIGFESALNGNLNVPENQKLIVWDKIKHFNSYILNKKLSHNLPLKNYYIKSHKI